ncbi:helix-turn-helix domain-containing protein [Paenibacillus wenxiniae]|uniref:Helix-turn-helix domain-containing protein n=1 Tax=Paenibacillus wenxiniae TaxID=1636843 RepID=A0ABW4RLF3_9BACL
MNKNKNVFALLRNNRGIDLDSVSKKLGISKKNLLKYENDFGKTPAHVAFKLMIFYNQTPALFSYNG